MPDGGSVTYDDKDGVARITLNRPDLLNAINTDMLRQLSSILEQVRANNEVKAVMITGAGERAFSAGCRHRLSPQGGNARSSGTKAVKQDRTREIQT